MFSGLAEHGEVVCAGAGAVVAVPGGVRAGLGWGDAGGRFLAWLRTGDGPQVVSIERRPARFAESTIAARLQAVMSCYRYHQLTGVALGSDLIRLVHGRGGSYKPMLEHLARRTGRRRAVIQVRRTGRATPPLLRAGQIERICDACAAWDAETCRWRDECGTGCCGRFSRRAAW